MLDPTLVPLSRATLLWCTNAKILAYMEVFVDYLLGLDQVPTYWLQNVRRTLFHALENLLIPLDKLYPTQENELLSLKNIYAGEF